MPETNETVIVSNDENTATAAAPSGPSVDALTMAPDALTRRLDRLNLTQALLDFEIANARVLDLTARLVDSNKRVLKLQGEADAARAAIDGARGDIAELQRRIAEVEASTTYRTARKLGSLGRLRRFLRK